MGQQSHWGTSALGKASGHFLTPPFISLQKAED
jgi:hypothetical protein